MDKRLVIAAPIVALLAIGAWEIWYLVENLPRDPWTSLRHLVAGLVLLYVWKWPVEFFLTRSVQEQLIGLLIGFSGLWLATHRFYYSVPRRARLLLDFHVTALRIAGLLVIWLLITRAIPNALYGEVEDEPEHEFPS